MTLRPLSVHDMGMQPAENHPESNVPEGQNLSDDAIRKHLATGLLRFLWEQVHIITNNRLLFQHEQVAE